MGRSACFDFRSSPRLPDRLAVPGLLVDQQDLNLLVGPLRKEHVAADSKVACRVLRLQRQRIDLLLCLLIGAILTALRSPEHCGARADYRTQDRTSHSATQRGAGGCPKSRADRATGDSADGAAGKYRL